MHCPEVSAASSNLKKPAAPMTSGRRFQYISKLPSSALLKQSVTDALEAHVSVARLKIKEGSEQAVLRKIQEASENLFDGAAWRVLKVAEGLRVWEISETAKPPPSNQPTEPSTPSTPSTPATQTTQTADDRTASQSAEGTLDINTTDSLTPLLGSIKDLLTAPSTTTRRRVLLDNSILTTGGIVVTEIFKIKDGQNAELIDNVTNHFSACVPRSMTESMGIELQQDLSDHHLYFILYFFADAATHQTFEKSEGWAKWRRLMTALIDSTQSQRIRSFSLFHSHGDNPDAASLKSLIADQSSTTAQDEVVNRTGGWALSGDGTEVICENAMLEPHADQLRDRYTKYLQLRRSLSTCAEGKSAGSLTAFAEAYRHFGLRRCTSGWQYRDWLPGAKEVYLIGDFNEWNFTSHRLTSEDEAVWGPGVFGIYLPDKADGTPLVKRMSKFKIRIKPEGDTAPFDRVSPWAVSAKYSESTQLFDGVVYDMKNAYTFRHPTPSPPKSLKVYEAHVGSSSAYEKVATFDDLRCTLLPRIKRLGYNTLLLVGLQEHSFYGSFGWHVTSFYAPTSRCGDPAALMRLIDEAHRLGILVGTTIVHSHAAPSSGDGLLQLDTTESTGAYFRQGKWGHQAEWDAHIFDTSNPNVIRFLLGNLCCFAKDYNMDLFRFEGITSMLYHHHGVNKKWPADHDETPSDFHDFFNYDVDEHSLLYLMLANEVLHSMKPNFITIANEKSVYPTLCQSVTKGGIGFDYRLDRTSAGAWVQMTLDGDEEFNLRHLMNTLQKRYEGEKVLSCAERYDTVIRGKRPLKIAMFAWESLLTHAVGGVAPHVTELAAGLSRLGHEVHVYVRATASQNAHSIHYGVHYHECNFDLSNDFVGEVMNMCNSFVCEMRSTESFMKERFAICHAHDWLASKALSQAAADGHTCIQTMHSTEYGRCGNNAYGGVSQRIHNLESEGCSSAGRVICVSGVLAQEVTRLYGVHPGKIRVIYNGINANQFDGVEDAAAVKAQHGIGAMEPLFLFVGRIAVQKGPDLLVEAIPNVLAARSDAKFIIVGDGHMLDGLHRLVDQLGIGHACKLVGKRNGAQLVSLFKASDAVVVPSRNEPFGIVVLEAWSAHKPVVATTCGGPRDFVSHDTDGFLVDPTPSSIAWGCCKILENFEHAQWMGSRGRVKAAFSFSWDTIANQTRDCYYEQLARNDAAYCESARGDSTLASRLLGSDIFDKMTVLDGDEHVARGLALHKMIRLMTCGIAGEAYMNTMGNEFAQPEFIDLPRGCNNFSYHHARTRWDLADDKSLKFKLFELFDACMIHLEQVVGWLSDTKPFVTICNEDDKVTAFERGPALFVFNFHWKTYENYQLGHSLGVDDLEIVLSTDDGKFGGLDRVPTSTLPRQTREPFHDRKQSVFLTLPPRTAMVLSAVTKNKQMPAVLKMSADDFVDSLATAS